jgi:Rieske Fe-S protein
MVNRPSGDTVSPLRSWGLARTEGQRPIMAASDDHTTGRGGTSRRAVLMGVGAIGATSLLAACGSDTPPATSTGAGTGPAAGPATTPPAPTTPPAIHTADIPVGGGTIYPEAMTVITQPTAGTFKAFDSTCQHLGCPVSAIANRLIVCGCHGSQYHIEDGSVAHGPTTKGLIPRTVTVTGDTLTIS